MTTHRLSAGSSGSHSPRVVKDHLSWTDDLPVCHLSGVGFSMNQRYREDGFRQEEHEFEDRSIHFSPGGSTYLYGVFDGHEGSRVSSFAAQRMPAELLLGQLDDTLSYDQETTDKKVNQILHQAIMAVEKGYFESIDDDLAERANLDIPEGMDIYELQNQHPELYKQLAAINARLSGGATAVVALVHKDTLYIANVESFYCYSVTCPERPHVRAVALDRWSLFTGASRALLCKTDSDGQLRVFQLSVDHDMNNGDELQRLEDLNVDVSKLKEIGHIGNKTYTRTLGDYHFKNSYKTIEPYNTANSEPLIATPEVTSGIPIDASCSFLILMSYGTYKSVEDAICSKHVNAEIAAMVASEFAMQTTLNGVAQAVVDKIVRLHHDKYMTSIDIEQKRLCQQRKDITLLVRNFNYKLPNATRSPISNPTTNPFSQAMKTALASRSNSSESPLANRSNSVETPLSVSIPDAKAADTTYRPFFPLTNNKTVVPLSNSNTTSTMLSRTNEATNSTYSSTNDSTNSADDSQSYTRSQRLAQLLPLDADGRIAAYIDFSEYYNGVEQFSEEERKSFEAEVELKPAYETIPEEREVPPTTPDEA